MRVYHAMLPTLGDPNSEKEKWHLFFIHSGMIVKPWLGRKLSAYVDFKINSYIFNCFPVCCQYRVRMCNIHIEHHNVTLT